MPGIIGEVQPRLEQCFVRIGKELALVGEQHLPVKDYDQEKWFELYQTALHELQRAAVSGRISDSRAEIAARLEKLKEHPALPKKEYLAIQDAISGLRELEGKEEALAADDKRRVLKETLNKLRAIAPGFDRQK